MITECGARGELNKQRPTCSFVAPHDGRAYGWFEKHMNFEARLRGKSDPEGRYETTRGRHSDRYSRWVERKKDIEVEDNETRKRARSVEAPVPSDVRKSRTLRPTASRLEAAAAARRRLSTTKGGVRARPAPTSPAPKTRRAPTPSAGPATRTARRAPRPASCTRPAATARRRARRRGRNGPCRA